MQIEARQSFGLSGFKVLCTCALGGFWVELQSVTEGQQVKICQKLCDILYGRPRAIPNGTGAHTKWSEPMDCDHPKCPITSIGFSTDFRLLDLIYFLGHLPPVLLDRSGWTPEAVRTAHDLWRVSPTLPALIPIVIKEILQVAPLLLLVGGILSGNSIINSVSIVHMVHLH